ncbi:hypothetical protein CDD81_2951 [Ophiocordyceps australis]|uniref:Autophagy-related protein 11 n=1 Tax=Ophiocordyceps australis TaxID=1399860 RepID=A0A2C5YIQ5_9HYPO|nr:hypothetical protein CDD81_2951 [Ophiocordyceps australis]
MATQVLIAHTGQRLEIDTTHLAGLDDFKACIARSSSLSLQHIVALTPSGRSVKLANLHAEREIYVYDVRVTQHSIASGSPPLVLETPLPSRLSVFNAPNVINDVQAIESWQALYELRRNWAARLVQDCSHLDAATAARYDEMDVMIQCLDAAVVNLEMSIKQIEPKYVELKRWIDPAIQEHGKLASNWDKYLNLARSTPVSPAMVKFMTRGDVDKPQVSLEDLIDKETAAKASKLATTAHRRFSEKAFELDRLAKLMNKRFKQLVTDFEKLVSRSVLAHNKDSSQLLEDIQSVASQIDVDYRSCLAYRGSQRDLTLASKTASHHTERLVPSLKKRALELDDMAQYATKARNSIACQCVDYMRTITDITVLHGNVKNQISIVNQSEDDMTTFDYLRLIHQLPYMYTSFLVESIRRREWVDKVRTDSSTLANEMALFQDEEAKRRKRWQKMIGSMYGPGFDAASVMGLEVNLLGDDVPWPVVTKDDLDTFVKSLQIPESDPVILHDIDKFVQELGTPTKQQSKRLRAFKNGSVHEAALGRSGLLIRGDDELVRNLQHDKTKLESKLKTAESRVRRLEDLLHRQSQACRPENLFQPQKNQSHERQDSTSSMKSYRLEDRRHSSDGTDVSLVRKIALLEEELGEERKRSTSLEQDLSARATQNDNLKDQLEEVSTTKRDLLQNMEALKHEFMDERKSLEQEIKLYKARLEDTEDEMEHFGESRENEKASYDDRIQNLVSEIERLTKEREDELLKNHGQVEYLRKEARLQRERLDASEQQVKNAKDASQTMLSKLEAAHDVTEKQVQALRRIHDDLAPEAHVPIHLAALTDSLGSHAADLLVKLRDDKSNHALVKAELEQAQQSIANLKAQNEALQSTLTAEEDKSRHLGEKLAEERTMMSALEEESAETKDQLKRLRKQLADGERESETLRTKIELADNKLTKLAEELASRQSQVGGLEEELHTLTQSKESLQSKLAALMSRFETRDGRSQDLTRRLHMQNERLTRLLERVGYSVTRESGGMTLSKVTRGDRNAQNANDSIDLGASPRRSSNMSDGADTPLLLWMKSVDEYDEAQRYQLFLEACGSFDLDKFSETIYLRIKEAEHKARKWQREARGYRDRAHALQRDANDKIAYRHFKEGDLALFLPTRNQQAGAWAAFNIGFPHYFLRPHEGHRLRQREWLVARISRIQERVVDLSKSLQSRTIDGESADEEENDNPFQLSDGLRWYLIDAQEDKAGAPTTPGMGKSTVAANKVEATADIQSLAHKGKGKNRDSVTSIEGINKTLSRSLDSRRSSSASKKALPVLGGSSLLKSSALASETNSLRAVATETMGEGVAPGVHDLEASAKGSEIQKLDSLPGP